MQLNNGLVPNIPEKGDIFEEILKKSEIRGYL